MVIPLVSEEVIFLRVIKESGRPLRPQYFRYGTGCVVWSRLNRTSFGTAGIREGVSCNSLTQVEVPKVILPGFDLRCFSHIF